MKRKQTTVTADDEHMQLLKLTAKMTEAKRAFLLRVARGLLRGDDTPGIIPLDARIGLLLGQLPRSRPSI